MGQEFVSLFHLETKRLLWLIGFTFTVILAFQFIELPFGNYFLFFPFSTSKTPAVERGSFQTADPTSDNNVTILNPNIANETRTSEEIHPTSISGDKNITWVKSGSSNYADSPLVSPAIPPPTYQIPSNSPPTNFTTPGPDLSHDSNVPSVWREDNNITSPTKNDENHVNIVVTQNSSSLIGVPSVFKDNITSSTENENLRQHNHVNTVPISGVLSISDMNKLLLQSHMSHRSMRPRWYSAVDQELQQARSEIENAPIIENDPSLYASLYRNVSMFKRSYDIMEERLKVYVYREGEKPIMHSPFLRGIYASEGWFMRLMEANKRFVTKNPKKAHLFYLPFSSRMLEVTLYVQDSHNHNNLKHYLNNYVDMIATKHPFWNRTAGSDHFLVACHDWAPGETKEKMAKCIRALCNTDVKEGFVFGKDVSLPETYIRNYQNPTRDMGGKPASRRSTLAFFAGNMHGYVRPILLQHWQDKDPDMKIFAKMPKSKGDRNYIQYMKSSKYCICAKGYEVNSPRVVEAILYECVPVIISDNFVPPFFEVLNWESFAVFVMEKDIPNLKNILISIPTKRYLQMQMRVRKVQQHFLWHAKPVKYDIFHMILHSIWYNRVFNAISR